MTAPKLDQKPSEILSDPALETRWAFGTLETYVQVNEQGNTITCGCQAALLLRAAGAHLSLYGTGVALQLLHGIYGVPITVLQHATQINDRLTDNEYTQYFGAETWAVKLGTLRAIAARKLPEVASYYREQGY